MNDQSNNQNSQSTDDQTDVVNITDLRDDPFQGKGIDPNTGEITDGAKESFRGQTSVTGANIGNPGVEAQGDAVASNNRETDTDSGDPDISFNYKDSSEVYSANNPQGNIASTSITDPYDNDGESNPDTNFNSNQNQNMATDVAVGENLTNREGDGTFFNDGDLQDNDTDTSRKNFDNPGEGDVADYLVNE